MVMMMMANMVMMRMMMMANMVMMTMMKVRGGLGVHLCTQNPGIAFWQ